MIKKTYKIQKYKQKKEDSVESEAIGSMAATEGQVFGLTILF